MKCHFCKTYNMMQKQADKFAIPERIMGISIVEAICMKGIIMEKKAYGIVQPSYCPVCGKWLRHGRKEAIKKTRWFEIPGRELWKTGGKGWG